MSYNNFKNQLDFLDTKVEITDIDECRQYSAMLSNKEDLPRGITYTTRYNGKGAAYYVFYRLATEDEIKTLIEISNAKSLKRTGDALHFFKLLTIWSLIIGLVMSMFGFLLV